MENNFFARCNYVRHFQKYDLSEIEFARKLFVKYTIKYANSNELS